MLDYLNPSDKEKLTQMGYAIVRKLGEGSYSKVYLAGYISPDSKWDNGSDFPRDQALRLAAKVIDRSRIPEGLMVYLDREIHVLGHLSHPHIIHVHSVLKRADLYMIFMRHAEYGDLGNFLQTYGALREKFARLWIRQIALALQFLHSVELAHRSVKCENILVTANNNVKLADFGLCSYTWDPETGQPLLSGTFCGSLPYAAPEVIKGNGPYCAKLADIWSLGIVLYAMLNKCLPFKSDNIGDLWKDQMARNFKFLRGVKDRLSPEAMLVTELLLQPNHRIRLSLEDLLKSKWMATAPSLLELAPMEKSALKRADRIRELLQPSKVRPGEAVVDNFDLNFDASICEDLVYDPCEEGESTAEDKINRGTYTTFEFEDLHGFDVDKRIEA